MNNKPSSRSANELFSIVLFLSLMFSNFGGNGLSSVQAQKTTEENLVSPSMKLTTDDEITIILGRYQIPESLLTSLIAKLGELGDKAGGATSFGVGYYEEHHNWAWINLLVANGSYFDNEAIGPTFLYFGVNNGNEWNVVLAENNQEYLSLLDTVSKDALDSKETELLDSYNGLNQTNTRVVAAAGVLLFPWPNSQNPWRFSSNGFHAAGFQSLGVEAGAEAIDLIPPTSMQPAKALAMETGTVVNKLECTWNTVLIVRHNGYPDTKRFVYSHIQNGTSTLGIGESINNRGQYLGELRTPVFNGYWSNGVCSDQGSGSFNCERDVNPATDNLCSSSDTRHLHLGFGTDRNIEIDGNVVVELVPGSNYNSTNQEIGNEGLISDEFSDSTLASSWHWVRETPTHWSLTASPGNLRIITQAKDIYEDSNNAPLLLQSLQPSSSDNFEIETRIVISPTANFHQGGLVIYGDDDNYVRLTYAYINGPMFEFAKEVNGVFQPIQIPAPIGINDFRLRMTKIGTNYHAYYSQDGVNWRLIGAHQDVNISPLEVGLSAFNALDNTLIEIPADFDYFRWTEGVSNQILDKSLYAISSTDLWQIDPYSGGSNIIGPTGYELTDIAFDGSTLYGVSFASFYSVDPNTGVASNPQPIGYYGNVNALTLGINGKLYAGTQEGDLLELNKSNGSLIKNIGPYGAGNISSGDLAARCDGKLFATVTRSGYSNDWLAEIDINNGHANLIGDIGEWGIYGLDFMDQSLYGTTTDGHLIEIDTATGQSTRIKTFPTAFRGQSTFNSTSPDSCITVNIGGDLMSVYPLSSGEERREYYPVSDGPVIVQSTNAVDLVSAIRLQSKPGATLYSFVETMGVPDGLLSYKYYFPTYNNTWTPLNSQLRFANINNTAITVRVTIGTQHWDYAVAANSERREYLPVSDGPVIIESLDPTKDIIAAIRLQSKPGATLYSFVETMGVPDGLLSYKYYFPTYNNTWAPLNSQLRFANINNTDITVRVTIGTQHWDYSVPANSERREYLPVSAGPVIIESLDPTKDIIAAIRLQSKPGATLYSFSETMGIPAEQLSDTYYFPTYNNTWAPLNSQLRFGVP